MLWGFPVLIFLATRRPLARIFSTSAFLCLCYLLSRISKFLQLNRNSNARMAYDPPHPHTQFFCTTFLKRNSFPTLPNKKVRISVPKTVTLCAPNPFPKGLYTVKHDRLQGLLADGFKLLPYACALFTAPFPYFDNSHCFVGAKHDKTLRYNFIFIVIPCNRTGYRGY